MNLVKSVRVMHMWRRRSIGDWIFVVDRDEGEEVDSFTLILPNQDYEEMGKPAWVTVTVESE